MNPEVLIVGGGVIGLSIARELHRRGAGRITIVDKGVCGQEASWAAAGMLGPQAEADEGGTFYDLCCESRDMYPALAAELLAETGVDIELDRTGTLSLAFTDGDEAEIRRRYDWQTRAGMSVEHLSGDETRRAEPFVSPAVRSALLFPGDWQVENRKLVTALIAYAGVNGIEIVENTTVDGVLTEGRRVTGVESASGSIFAGTTVLATGAWTSHIKLGPAVPPLKVEPVKGQIIAMHSAKRSFQHVLYSRRGYMVPRVDGRILAGSTSEDAGFDKSPTTSAADALRDMASEIAPSTAGLKVADHWAGLRPYAFDSMPVLGVFDSLDDLTIATAHYRNGILLAPVTARLIADRLLSDIASEYLSTFGPDRFQLREVGTTG